MSKDLAVFDTLRSDITALVSPVKTLVVKDFQSGQVAIDTAKQVKELIKRLETTRKSLVDPLNKQVKSINEYAKGIEAPLIAAEAHIKAQLVAFEREQEKLREEARKKAEEELRKKEAELKAKQEAERAELEARLAENDDAASIFGTDEAEKQAEIEALEKKAAEERAVLNGEAAAKEWDINQQGIKNAKKVWKCELVDLNLVPKEYLIIELNEKAILAMARAGVTNIPGVRVWQETTVAIGTNTYVPKLALGSK